MDTPTAEEMVDYDLYSIEGTPLNALSRHVAETCLTGFVLRQDAKDRLSALIDILIVNVAKLIRKKQDYPVGEQALIIQLSAAVLNKGSRYKTTTLVNNQRLNTALQLLEGVGFFRVVKGSTERKLVQCRNGSTRYVQTATRAYPAAFEEELSLISLETDIGVREGRETIVLKASDKSLLEYQDNDLTHDFRRELKIIQEHMNNHPVSYLGNQPVDLSATHLTRIFNNGGWDQGGRLAGHWAMNLKANIKRDGDVNERQYLRIDGEPVFEVDWSSMFLNLLHIRYGHSLPTFDPYEIDGLPKAIAKLTVLILLNINRRTRQAPDGWYDAFPDRPKRYTWPYAVDAVLKHDPLLAEYAFKGVGLKLMRMESNCLIRALSHLVDMGIGFVPLHDGILVPASKGEMTIQAMDKASKFVLDPFDRVMPGRTLVARCKPLKMA